MNRLSTQKSFDSLFAADFMDMINDAFFVFDYSLHFLFVNKKAASLVGKTKKELLGKTVSQVFPEVKKTSLYIDFLKSRRFSKKPIEYYSPSMKKWLTVSVYPTKHGIAVCAKDITVQKKIEENAQKAEKALQESKIQLDAVFQILPIGIGLSDAKGNYILSNKTMKHYIPTNVLPSKDNSLYLRWEAYNPDGTRIPRENYPGARALRGEYVLPGMEMLYLEDDGTKTWTRVAAIPLKDEDGKVCGQIAIVLDISEEKRNEQRKDDFINMASHELKTPLTTAKILLQFLQKHLQENPKYAILVNKMDAQIDKLTLLVGELLDVTRLEKGELKLQNEVFLVKPIVEDVIEELQLTTIHRLVVDWHTKLFVYGDKRRLRQVLVNLITNAVKFSPEKTDVIIASHKKNNSLVVSVQDFGIGISKEDQEHIFDRFYQVTKNNGNTFPGLGLGLFIANEVIIRMGGKMWCESEEGKGSKLYFSLPIYKNAN